jgi:hypothetical protein
MRQASIQHEYVNRKCVENLTGKPEEMRHIHRFRCRQVYNIKMGLKIFFYL